MPAEVSAQYTSDAGMSDDGAPYPDKRGMADSTHRIVHPIGPSAPSTFPLNAPPAPPGSPTFITPDQSAMSLDGEDPVSCADPLRVGPRSNSAWTSPPSIPPDPDIAAKLLFHDAHFNQPTDKLIGVIVALDCESLRAITPPGRRIASTKEYAAAVRDSGVQVDHVHFITRHKRTFVCYSFRDPHSAYVMSAWMLRDNVRLSRETWEFDYARGSDDNALSHHPFELLAFDVRASGPAQALELLDKYLLQGTKLSATPFLLRGPTHASMAFISAAARKRGDKDAYTVRYYTRTLDLATQAAALLEKWTLCNKVKFQGANPAERHGRRNRCVFCLEVTDYEGRCSCDVCLVRIENKHRKITTETLLRIANDTSAVHFTEGNPHIHNVDQPQKSKQWATLRCRDSGALRDILHSHITNGGITGFEIARTPTVARGLQCCPRCGATERHQHQYVGKPGFLQPHKPEDSSCPGNPRGDAQDVQGRWIEYCSDANPAEELSPDFTAEFSKLNLGPDARDVSPLRAPRATTRDARDPGVVNDGDTPPRPPFASSPYMTSPVNASSRSPHRRRRSRTFAAMLKAPAHHAPYSTDGNPFSVLPSDDGMDSPSDDAPPSDNRRPKPTRRKIRRRRKQATALELLHTARNHGRENTPSTPTSASDAYTDAPERPAPSKPPLARVGGASVDDSGGDIPPRPSSASSRPISFPDTASPRSSRRQRRPLSTAPTLPTPAHSDHPSADDSPVSGMGDDGADATPADYRNTKTTRRRGQRAPAVTAPQLLHSALPGSKQQWTGVPSAPDSASEEHAAASGHPTQPADVPPDPVCSVDGSSLGDTPSAPARDELPCITGNSPSTLPPRGAVAVARKHAPPGVKTACIPDVSLEVRMERDSRLHTTLPDSPEPQGKPLAEIGAPLPTPPSAHCTGDVAPPAASPACAFEIASHNIDEQCAVTFDVLGSPNRPVRAEALPPNARDAVTRYITTLTPKRRIMLAACLVSGASTCSHLLQ